MTWTLQLAGGDINGQDEFHKGDDKDCVMLTIHNNIMRDDQVMNSYGPKSNEELLASYGFVDVTMRDDTLALKLGNISLESENPLSIQPTYYWKYEKECPEGLLEEIIEKLGGTESLDDEDDFGDLQDSDKEKINSLMEKGQAYEVLIGMLEAKYKNYLSWASDARDFSETRPHVRRAIEVYHEGEQLVEMDAAFLTFAHHQGQQRILEWALKEARRNESLIEKSIATLLQC